MCKWGTDKMTLVRIPSKLSHTGKARVAIRAVDSCISDIVQALVMAGIWTIGSCCGHEKSPGVIGLEDGRTVMVFQNDAEVHKYWIKKDSIK